MISVTKKHTFSAAHRLYDYNGQCEHLHGHNYQVELTITKENLNSLGMIVDFADIKHILLHALDKEWDHKTLLYAKDPLSHKLAEILTDGSVCTVPFNPTAENMAAYLGTEFFPQILRKMNMPKDLKIVKVTIFETEHNSASWSLN